MNIRTSIELSEMCRMEACTHLPLLKEHRSTQTYNPSIRAATRCIQAGRRGDDDLLRFDRGGKVDGSDFERGEHGA